MQTSGTTNQLVQDNLLRKTAALERNPRSKGPEPHLAHLATFVFKSGWPQTIQDLAA